MVRKVDTAANVQALNYMHEILASITLKSTLNVANKLNVLKQFFSL